MTFLKKDIDISIKLTFKSFVMPTLSSMSLNDVYLDFIFISSGIGGLLA